MKTHPKTASILIILALSIALITACNRDPAASPSAQTSSASYSIYMTDAPGNYQAVNVNIIGVEIHSDVSGWVALNMNAGVYNLLKLANGMDTLLAGDTVITGNVSQVRLILGDTGNTVESDSVWYPLQTPSAQESGLKINVHTDFVANARYSIMLDFDAANSVVETGADSFLLKPVIRATVTQVH